MSSRSPDRRNQFAVALQALDARHLARMNVGNDKNLWSCSRDRFVDYMYLLVLVTFPGYDLAPGDMTTIPQRHASGDDAYGCTCRLSSTWAREANVSAGADVDRDPILLEDRNFSAREFGGGCWERWTCGSQEKATMIKELDCDDLLSTFAWHCRKEERHRCRSIRLARLGPLLATHFVWSPRPVAVGD